MKDLYLPVTIPDFVSIQNQLFCLIQTQDANKQGPFAYNVSETDVLKCSPQLVAWIKSKSKVDVLHYRIYVTPPSSRLLPHIDGGGVRPIVPFRLNIPIAGTQGTRLVFFTTPPENLKTDIPESYLSSTRPIDFTNLQPVDSVEIVTPHFVNTSVLHGVKNTTKNVRAMFVVTWLIDDKKYREIEEVFNVD